MALHYICVVILCYGIFILHDIFSGEYCENWHSSAFELTIFVFHHTGLVFLVCYVQYSRVLVFCLLVLLLVIYKVLVYCLSVLLVLSVMMTGLDNIDILLVGIVGTVGMECYDDWLG